MKNARLILPAAFLVLGVGCGSGGMGNSGGESGGGGNGAAGNSNSASLVVSKTTSGAFLVAMSTSFQPAEWDDQFFTLNPTATASLARLGPHHIRLQGVSQGVPQGSEGTTSTAWDFSVLDAITQPVLGVGDHSPEFQIAKAPAFLYQNDSSSDSFTDLTFAQFAGYAQNLVQYYNTGGFTANGQLYESPAFSQGDKITWWGIYNEPNINNNLTPQQYTDLYNAVVPAMQLVDPSLKFAALELADFSGQESTWVPPFVSGVKAQVDVVATHFYSTCNQKDSDTTLFETIPGFAADVQAFYTTMATNPALSRVPVWVTENNVNADYSTGNGMSACNPGQVFVEDVRGSSPFFAAWRPYVFSQLGKAGVQALYHWDYGADKQYGEVDYNTGDLQLSYWVDYWLGQMFPPSAGSQVLENTSSDDTDLETLAVINGDGSVVVMVANHAVSASSDNNGSGVPFDVSVDVSALGKFSSGSLLVIDKNTTVTTGPSASTVTPANQMAISLDGYSVGFLTLKP